MEEESRISILKRVVLGVYRSHGPAAEHFAEDKAAAEHQLLDEDDAQIPPPCALLQSGDNLNFLLPWAGARAVRTAERIIMLRTQSLSKQLDIGSLDSLVRKENEKYAETVVRC